MPIDGGGAPAPKADPKDDPETTKEAFAKAASLYKKLSKKK